MKGLGTFLKRGKKGGSESTDPRPPEAGDTDTWRGHSHTARSQGELDRRNTGPTRVEIPAVPKAIYISAQAAHAGPTEWKTTW